MQFVPENRNHQKSPSVQNRTDTEIQTLRNPLAELFQAFRASSDYDCTALKMQLVVNFRNEKVGGLNRTKWHLYISKVFVDRHGTPELMRSFGFEYIVQNNGHEYWKLGRISDHQSFQRAIEEMTGVQCGN